MLAELGQPDVWNEPERAQELGKEKARLEATLEPLEQSLTGLDDAEELLELALAEADEEVLQQIIADVTRIAKAAEALEFQRMFNGEQLSLIHI